MQEATSVRTSHALRHECFTRRTTAPRATETLARFVVELVVTGEKLPAQSVAYVHAQVANLLDADEKMHRGFAEYATVDPCSPQRMLEAEVAEKAGSYLDGILSRATIDALVNAVFARPGKDAVAAAFSDRAPKGSPA